MPWNQSQARRHTRKARTQKDRETWSEVANETLERTGDEARAVRTANAVIKRKRGGK